MTKLFKKLSIFILIFSILISGNVFAAPGVDVSVSPNHILFGGEASYTIIVENTGNDIGYNLSILSDFSNNENNGVLKQVEFVSADAPFTNNELNSAGTIDFTNIKDMAPGERFKFNLTVKLSDAGANWAIFDDIENMVTATLDDLPDGSGTQVDGDETNTAPVLPISIINKFTLQSTESSQVTGVTDRPFFYQVRVKNNAKQITKNVEVVETMPDGIEFVSVESGHACVDSRDNATGITTLTCNVGDMAADGEEVLKFKVGIRYDYFGTDNGGTNRVHDDFDGTPALGVVIEDKTLFESESQLNTSGNTWNDNQLQTYVDFVKNSSFVNAAYATIDKNISATNPGNGSEVTYSLVVATSEYYDVIENAGNNSITVHDKLPDGLTYVDGSENIAFNSKVVNGDGTTDLTWTADELDPLAHSSSFTISFKVTIDEFWNDGRPIVSRDTIVNVADFQGEWDDVIDTTRANGLTGAQASSGSAVSVSVTMVSPPIKKEVRDTDGTWKDSRKATVGDDLEFRLRFNTNDGANAIIDNIKMGNIQITDWLPKGVSFVAVKTVSYSDVNDFSGDPDTENMLSLGSLTGINWDLGVIEQGGWWEAIIQVKVDDSLDVDNDITVVNMLKMSGENSAGAMYVDRDTVDIEYTLPILTLTKSVIKNATFPGDTIDYRVDIVNSGTAAAKNIIFKDILDDDVDGNDPANISISGVDPANYTVTYDDATKEFIITFDDTVEIGIGSTMTIDYTVTVDNGAGAGETIENIATVGYSTQQSSSTYDGRVVSGTANPNDANTFYVATTIPRVSVNKTVEHDPYKIGSEIPYRVQVTIPAKSIVYWPSILDTINRDGIEYVANSAAITDISGTPVSGAVFDGGSEPTVNTAGNDNTTLNWNFTSPIDNRGQDEDYVFNLDYHIKYTGLEDDGATWEFMPPTLTDQVSNSASFKWNSEDVGVRATDSSEADTEIIDINQPLLSVEKTVNPNQPVSPGDNLTYTVSVTNVGDAEAFNIVMDDSLSSYLDNVVATEVKVNNVVADAGDYTVTLVGQNLNIDFKNISIEQNEIIEITYTAEVNSDVGAGAVITNTVDLDWTSDEDITEGRAYDDDKDGVYFGDRDMVTLSVPNPGFTKTSSSNNVAIGEEFDYTLSVTANANLYDAKISDILPSGLEIISTTPVAVVNGNNVDLDLGDVNEGEIKTLVIRARVKNDASNHGVNPQDTLTNAGRFEWNTVNDDNNSVKNVTANKIVTITEPLMTINKTVSSATADIDDTLTYTVTLSNTGTAPLKHIYWSDTVPTGLVDVTLSSVKNNNLNVDQADYIANIQDGGSTSDIIFNDSVVLNNGNAIVIVYTAKVANTVSTGDTLSNSSAFTGSTLSDGGANGRNYNGTDSVSVVIANTSIGDKVWFDLDKDGIQDAGEPGMENVEVRLLDNNENPVNHPVTGLPYIVHTDNNGNYLFANINDGDYILEFIKPAGYTIANQDNGWDDEDSDINASGKTDVINLAHNTHITDVDAGFIGASISGIVWHDTNTDGTRNGDTVYNVGAELSIFDNQNNQILNPVTGLPYILNSDINGEYKFENLPAGDYKIELTKPVGYQLVLKDQGVDDTIDSDFNIVDSHTDTINLTSGEEKNNIDAGVFQPSSIEGMLWIDENRDGVRGPDDLRSLSNIILKLIDNNGNTIKNILTNTDYEVITGANGEYEFINLIAGDYIIHFEIPESYYISPKDNGGDDTIDSDIDDIEKDTELISLLENQNILNVDAGVTLKPSGSSGVKHGGGSSSPVIYTCKDTKALNFSNTGIHDQSLCKYKEEINGTEEVEKEAEENCRIIKATCPVFTQHMKLGDRDGQMATHKQEAGVSKTINEVKLLQTHLKKQGFYAGKIDGYYGKEVFDAVSRWQEKYRTDVLDPWNLKKPTGYFYKSSERNMNIILGCNDEVVLDTGKVLSKVSNLKVLDYAKDGVEICSVEEAVEEKEQLISGEKCSASQILTQNLRAGARDGRYNWYTKGIVKEVKILQTHMNRLGFNAGEVDGILGPITDRAIKRMQEYLGTKADGLVGPITRRLINNSCR